MPGRPSSKFGWLALPWIAFACLAGEGNPAPRAIVQFLYTSDLHFGLHSKGTFQGSAGPVPAQEVNAQAVRAMNRLPMLAAPADGGVKAGEPLGNLDFLAITGDLANRQEAGPPAIQPAAASWAQFQATYLQGLTLRNPQGQPLPILLTPGNHDVSNAIGYPRPLAPATDATSMVGIHNVVFPDSPISLSSFAYSRHKVFYTKDFGGVHFVFLNMWLDRDMRARLDQDLKALPAPGRTPVVLMMHMPPEQESKNFTDPGSRGNRLVFANGYQNLLAETLPSLGTRRAEAPVPAEIEEELSQFLAAHKTIVAWFHGHENYNQFRVWRDARHRVALPAFRVDSPLKGRFSARDEKRLSFQAVAIDPDRQLMTVRECLWNTTGAANGPITWGDSITVSLALPRPEPPGEPGPRAALDR